MVVDGAHRALESGPKEGAKDVEDWSDWSLAEDSAYQELQERVTKLEASTLDGLASVGELYGKLLERVADLEADGPRGDMGRGVGFPSTTKSSRKSVSDSKVVLNLAEREDLMPIPESL